VDEVGAVVAVLWGEDIGDFELVVGCEGAGCGVAHGEVGWGWRIGELLVDVGEEFGTGVVEGV